jgi:hypothetical protein
VPIYYGVALGHLGISVPPLIGTGVILVIGVVCARLLRHRRSGPGLVEGR